MIFKVYTTKYREAEWVLNDCPKLKEIGEIYINDGGYLVVYIENLAQLKELQEVTDEELIIDFRNMTIEIYNDWRE